VYEESAYDPNSASRSKILKYYGTDSTKYSAADPSKMKSNDLKTKFP